ncbi:MAG TPA: L-histidine N(alpha)-methyltransferase [Bryobacteraceae bacterium]|nr:L-histidine N(alpha)-methyltransferase [Bryobacteraceae bacterium]
MSTARSASFETESQFAFDVRDGLLRPRKTLPPKYLYDSLGSALFEAITLLPEYGVTRADQHLIGTHAAAIAQAAGAPGHVIELGSGTGRKTGALLQAIPGNVTYFPVDVSARALEDCVSSLADIARVVPTQGEFLDGLRQALRGRVGDRPVLVLFLGSTIGNFDGDGSIALLRSVRQTLRQGDHLLLGADLLKAPERLVLAYDDPTGITAAFNRNVLGRINRELGGDFDLRRFRHEARWVASASRVEMHLVATAQHTVDIPGADCWSVHFNEGESVWTESSHKYTIADLDRLAGTCGFTIAQNWVDHSWGFAESLWAA